MSEVEKPMLPTGSVRMQDEKEMSKKTETDTTSLPERPIRMIQQRQPSSASEDTSENHSASYVPLNETLFEEFSTELKVLSESTELLHGQTKELLRKPESEMRKVDHYNIEQARANMNTIAKLIQTKINFAKILK